MVSLRILWVLTGVVADLERRAVFKFGQRTCRNPMMILLRDLRQNMPAIVEVCWVEPTWKGLQKSGELVRFPLWDEYKNVNGFLEVENGQRLKRFVVSVRHPQCFYSPRRQTDWNREARTQDAALSFASRGQESPIFWGENSIKVRQR